MKYKSKMVTLFKVLRVFDIIAFVISIIGAIGEALSAIMILLLGTNPGFVNAMEKGFGIISDTLLDYGIVFDSIIPTKNLISFISLVSVMGFITTVFAIVMLGLVLKYFNTVIKLQSPFNSDATKKLTAYGVAFVIMGAVASIIEAIVYVVAKQQLAGFGIAADDISFEISINSMIFFGIFCILVNIIFKYGGELEDKVSQTPMLISEPIAIEAKEEIKEEAKEEDDEIKCVSISLSDLEKPKQKKVVVIKRK